MGYPTCHPLKCPRFAYLITGSFILKKGQACIIPDPPTSAQVCLKVEAHVKQAFAALAKENKKSPSPAPIPDYGIIILLGGKDGKLSDARVLAFIPLTAPTDNTKRMSPQRALDLYQTMFLNRNNTTEEFYKKLIKTALR